MILRFVLNSETYGALILNEDPGGWKDMEAVLKRSLEYHGIFYEAVAQLEFKCGSGKEYIDTAILEEGIDSVINITISVSCSTKTGTIEAPDYSIDYSDDYGSMISGSNAPSFDTIFEGVLNLSNYNQTDESTTVDLIQSDFVQKVINRFDTNVNLDSLETLDGGTVDALTNVPYNLTIPSKGIRFGTELELAEDLQVDPFVFPDVGDAYSRFYIFHPFGVVFDDLNTNTIIPSVESNESVFYQPQALFTAEHTGIHRFTYNFQGNILMHHYDDSTVTYTWQLKWGVNQTGGASTQIGSNFGHIFGPNSTHSIPFSFSGTLNVSLNEGDDFQFYFRNSDGASFHVDITLQYTECDLTSYIDTTTSDSTSGAYYIHEVGAMISQRITGQNDAFRSELSGRKNSQPVSYDENGCASFTAITNGKKIRKFPFEKSPLTVSMSDFFKTVNSIYNVGLGFEKIGDAYVLRMEGKEYFYSTDVVLQLPNCPNIKTSVAKEYYATDIYIGYEKWESEETNGIDEINSKHEYNTGIKALQAKKELLSPMIASSYAIEFTRRKRYANFPSLDWKYDDDNFILCLNRSVDSEGVPNDLETVELDENYSQINNVYSPDTTYNYRISPARNLLRHISSIAGSIIKYPLRAIKFVYGEGNYLAETQFTADTCPGNFNNELLIENQDITVEESGETAIWEPEYLDFQYPLTQSQYLLIKANQFKCIEVSDGEDNFQKGFIIDLRYKIVGGLTTFKLLKAHVD